MRHAILLCLLSCLPVSALAADDAPKGFPTRFVVLGAMTQEAKLFQQNKCQMSIQSGDEVYFVTAIQPFGLCHAFSPGTSLYGDLRKAGRRDAIYLLDTTGSEPKSRKYRVENVHPAPQR
jgi:hypothetical protein